MASSMFPVMETKYSLSTWRGVSQRKEKYSPFSGQELTPVTTDERGAWRILH